MKGQMMTAAAAAAESLVGFKAAFKNAAADAASVDETEDAERMSKLVERTIHWCLVNGFVVVPKECAARDGGRSLVVTYLPFNLYPTGFKRHDFNQVVDLQPRINELVYKIASSPGRLESALENLIKIDPFISALWSVYQRALKDGFNQTITFTIMRCDYMLHQPPKTEEEEEHDAKVSGPVMKQVEMNTIAAGFGYVSTRMSQLHREILKWTGQAAALDRLPENAPICRLAAGFVEAWRLYGNSRAVVLFIVLDVEINIADQRHLEYEIVKQEPRIAIQRCTLKEIQANGRLDEDKFLYYEGAEVAIVYFRAGYAPSHYKSQAEWDALLSIESSRAVKCPSVGTFLAGMKKIQEFLYVEKNLVDLCNNDRELVDSFQAVFAQFLRLDDQENFKRVMENPGDFVLKPQREGGGNNYYDDQITEILTKIRDVENNNRSNGTSNGGGDYDEDLYHRDRFIAMERLKPTSSYNYLISSKSHSSDPLKKTEVTSELGVFGVLVRDENTVYTNEASGYCLRSKPSNDYEVGVMCGSGALDSIYFVD